LSYLDIFAQCFELASAYLFRCIVVLGLVPIKGANRPFCLGALFVYRIYVATVQVSFPGTLLSTSRRLLHE